MSCPLQIDPKLFQVVLVVNLLHLNEEEIQHAHCHTQGEGSGQRMRDVKLSASLCIKTEHTCVVEMQQGCLNAGLSLVSSKFGARHTLC